MLIAAIGLMLSGLGVGIFLYSSLGVDPASVFTQGMGNVFQLRYGVMAAIINVVILAIVFLVDRKYVSIASVMAIFLIGATADVVSVLLSTFIAEQIHIMIRCIMILVGCAIMGMGIATYIRAGLGVGAIDLVSEIISDKTKIPYRYMRVGADIIFVVVGYLLGGSVGAGTLVGAVLTGPAVQLFRPVVYKIVDPMLGQTDFSN
jgi:Predicted membrane protein